MSALFFGSISALADTSELQREAFNQAFREHRLDWEWDRETYRGLLGSNGGADRIAAYARDRGESVDAAAVHATKSALFQRNLLTSEVAPRPGVVQTIKDARAAGTVLAFVTTTSAENLKALFTALEPAVAAGDFDLVLSAGDVEPGKPDPAVYRLALERLGLAPGDAVAVEDNPGGVQAARAAGVRVVAFPNENTAGLDLGAERTVERLALAELQTA
ncbi:HAD-IA family hydrolase [Kineosporia rhizophila]|uniref:HAD family hydrolase n=1 Tax=Kineosporia rhizophila TaxID=84633 RepID=UPI001E3EA6C9|nr:HAD-IA family hydrolase [Kineosporia rhizophila]MCE0537618.1 HAD-IA family hydrolase [Kineosporia rhizophila]